MSIVVTGMGVLSSAGCSLEEFWNNLSSCKITYGVLEELHDNPNYRIKIGAKINTTNWSDNLSQHIRSTYGKSSCYAVSTALKAVEDAGLDLKTFDPSRIAVIMGTTMGEAEVEETITRMVCSGEECSKEIYQKYPASNIAQAIAQEFGVKGHQYVVPAACAAGNYAISIGKMLLENNIVDIVIAGGVDVFSYVSFAGFQRLLSLSPDLCRPFDKNRKGLVIGEGCGIIVMERDKDRSHQKIYGKILGTGLASDAYHMTSPKINGEGEIQAMTKALEDAGLTVSDIDYISAHGTGTKLNDKTEAHAINQLFGKDVPKTSSIKSMIGHSMGAASVLELIASFLMMKYGILLPTVNYETKDEECDFDVVANQIQYKNCRTIMSNAFAFGGQTSSVIIGK